ncbi:MAG: Unknown protein [uncultured Sulfurovum sp.]|uniref:Uncharacterized protein n=1 Tax=uncultured Sulfurovum sp. TaxID=269237 RepID=A0A6S6TKP6_9BACT|nr:MAG: Unknown protein [uncultured Sulfurovum sp.]
MTRIVIQISYNTTILKQGNMMKKSFLSVAVATFILTGCGSNGSNTGDSDDGGNPEVVAPVGYDSLVINNKGDVVESKLGKLSIKLYSNVADVADAQSMHKGVVVNVNGEDSETMPIQASYVGDEIKVAVYDENNKLLAASDAIEVADDVPVVLVNVSI